MLWPPTCVHLLQAEELGACHLDAWPASAGKGNRSHSTPVVPHADPLVLCCRPLSDTPKSALVQAEELDARILGAIIAGVRRAFPFVAADDVEPLVQRHSDALFRMVHTASFGVAVQALLLLFQLMSAQNSVSDRFYRWVEVTSLQQQWCTGSFNPQDTYLLRLGGHGTASRDCLGGAAVWLCCLLPSQPMAKSCLLPHAAVCQQCAATCTPLS